MKKVRRKVIRGVFQFTPAQLERVEQAFRQMDKERAVGEAAADIHRQMGGYSRPVTIPTPLPRPERTWAELTPEQCRTAGMTFLQLADNLLHGATSKEAADMCGVIHEELLDFIWSY
jgi:hypothetical protein